MNSNNTQITSADGYDTNRLRFSKPQKCTITNTTISYRRIWISTANDDGTEGELVVPTSKVFSFGVGENLDPTTKVRNGYVMPLCLWNRDGPTPEEKMWTDMFDQVVEACKDYLVQNREELELDDLTKAELKKFNPLYWKKEKGKVVKDRGPTLYAKLIESKKQGLIKTAFFDDAGETIDPLSLLKKYCHVTAVIKFESIFLGSGKCLLQVKLYEAQVSLLDGGMKKLLPRPKPQPKLFSAKTTNPLDEDDQTEVDTKVDTKVEGTEKDETGSIHGSDDETEPETKSQTTKAKTPPKRVVKKVVRRVKKKTEETEE